MIALYIIGGIILLVAVVLLLNVRLSVSYLKDVGEEGKLISFASLGPVKIKLFPSKKKKIALSDYSPKNYRRMMELSKDSSTVSDKEKTTKKKEKSKLLPEGLTDTLDLVIGLLEKFSRHIRCSVIRIRIFAGTKDAALTAYAYTMTASAVDFILEFIDEHAVLKLKAPKDVLVDADFDTTEFRCDVSIKLSIRIINVLRAAIAFLKDNSRFLSRLGIKHKK